jgi:hypothetical protein
MLVRVSPPLVRARVVNDTVVFPVIVRLSRGVRVAKMRDAPLDGTWTK